MKAQITSYAAISVLTSILLLANTISSADALTTNIRYKGQSADAYWYFEENGIYTDVFVWVSEYTSQQRSDRYTDSSAYVGIYQYKLGNEVCYTYDGQQYCWNEYIPLQAFFGYTSIQPGAFTTQGKLEAATLDLLVGGYDYLADPAQAKTVTIKVQWTGEGEYSSGNSNYHYRSSTYDYNGHYIGLYRQASATASISGDINLNLGNSLYGYLSDVKAGYVDITNP